MSAGGVAIATRTDDAVFAYLTHEADMDGLVTCSWTEVGRAVGAHVKTVLRSRDRLVSQGRIRVVFQGLGSRDSGHGTVVPAYSEIQLLGGEWS